MFQSSHHQSSNHPSSDLICLDGPQERHGETAPLRTMDFFLPSLSNAWWTARPRGRTLHSAYALGVLTTEPWELTRSAGETVASDSPQLMRQHRDQFLELWAVRAARETSHINTQKGVVGALGAGGCRDYVLWCMGTETSTGPIPAGGTVRRCLTWRVLCWKLPKALSCKGFDASRSCTLWFVEGHHGLHFFRAAGPLNRCATVTSPFHRFSPWFWILSIAWKPYESFSTIIHHH